MLVVAVCWTYVPFAPYRTSFVPENVQVWFSFAQNVHVGADPVTVNPELSVPVPPAGLVTVTSRAPCVAVLANWSGAVSCVGDASITFDTVIPAPMLTISPVANADPLIVTATVVPGEA